MHIFHQLKRLYLYAILLTTLLFTGCSSGSNPIPSFDNMNYLYYTLTNTMTQESINITPTQASETKASMAVYHFLTQFNAQKDLGTTIDTLPVQDYAYHYALTAYDQEANTYTFDIYFENNTKEVFLVYEDVVKVYTMNDLIPLMENRVFDAFYSKTTPPTATLYYSNNAIDSIETTQLSQTFFDLYTQEDSAGTAPTKESVDALDTIDLNSETKSMEIYDVSQEKISQNHHIGDWALTDIGIDYMDDANNLKAHTTDLTLPDLNYGTYSAIATLSWEHTQLKAQYTQTIYYRLHYDTQESFEFSDNQYQPGDLAVLIGNHLSEKYTYDVDTDIYNQGLSFVREEDSSYLLLPLMSRTEPGDYALTITVSDNNVPIKTYDYTIHVSDKAFEVQHLTTSSGVASVRNEDNYAIMNADFKHGRSEGSPTKLWDGPFLQPVGGRISTEYGVIRYTNGSTESSRHSGIDFANPEGTPVVATQNGYIRLAKQNPVTGMTIFIDHGAGIYSQYYHLSSMSVKEGDYVEKGTIIGAVGTTGFSTGPHLHFCIYNKGIYLNPWKLFEKAPY